MTGFIFDFLMAVFSLKIVYEYLDIFFTRNVKNQILSGILWMLYFLWQAVGIFLIGLPAGLNLILNILLLFLITCVNYLERIIRKIAFVLMFNVLWMLTELVLGYGYLLFNISIYSEVEIGSLISKIMLLCIVNAIKIFKPASGFEYQKKYNLMLLMVPIGSIVILNSMFKITYYSEFTEGGITSLISAVIILAINVVNFETYKKLSEEWELQRCNMIYEKQLELCDKNIIEEQKMLLKIRNIKHDLKHHIIYLIQLVEAEQKENALNYMEKLIEEVGNIKKGISNTENLVIDSLVNYKYSIMKKYNIKFDFNIQIPISIPVDNADICVLLGNILDNAIEANQNCEEQARLIKLNILYDGANLAIRMENNFFDNLKKNMKKELLTTKKNPENHGMGLNSVKRIVDKYHGYFNYFIQDSIFITQILLYEKNKENYV